MKPGIRNMNKDMHLLEMEQDLAQGFLVSKAKRQTQNLTSPRISKAKADERARTERRLFNQAREEVFLTKMTQGGKQCLPYNMSTTDETIHFKHLFLKMCPNIS